MSSRLFQSSLEENPEWNRLIKAILGALEFQSSLEENPEWNSGEVLKPWQ